MQLKRFLALAIIAFSIGSISLHAGEDLPDTPKTTTESEDDVFVFEYEFETEAEILEHNGYSEMLGDGDESPADLLRRCRAQAKSSCSFLRVAFLRKRCERFVFSLCMTSDVIGRIDVPGI